MTNGGSINHLVPAGQLSCHIVPLPFAWGTGAGSCMTASIGQNQPSAPVGRAKSPTPGRAEPRPGADLDRRDGHRVKRLVGGPRCYRRRTSTFSCYSNIAASLVGSSDIMGTVLGSCGGASLRRGQSSLWGMPVRAQQCTHRKPEHLFIGCTTILCSGGWGNHSLPATFPTSFSQRKSICFMAANEKNV